MEYTAPGIPNVNESPSVNKQGSVIESVNETNTGMTTINREYCTERILSSMDYFRILVDRKHKVLYCAALKTGTSNWYLMFAYLSGKVQIKLTNQADNKFQAWDRKNQLKIGIDYLHNIPEDEAKKMLDTYYIFMFARHPFERLVSAYRDKFRPTSDRTFFHNLYGKDIIAKYRKNPTKNALKSGNDVTFPEFIKFVIDSARTNTSSFYISEMDGHWRPVHDMCHPCQINYNRIGRLEHFEENADFILNEGFNITQPIHFPVEKGGHKTTENIIREHFTNIPPEDIGALKKIYEQDFRLFNYSSDLGRLGLEL